MGEIIHGFDPALIIPARYVLSKRGILQPLREYLERKKIGLDLNPVVVKLIPGRRYAALEGLKNAIVAFAERQRVNLYVMEDKFDAIPYNYFPDVKPALINKLNKDIPRSFCELEDNLSIARRKGILDIRELVETNMEQLNLAWTEIMRKEISLPRGIEVQPPSCLLPRTA